MSISIKGKSLHIDDQYLHVELDDGRIISTPIFWYKELLDAPLKQLMRYQFICQGTGIEWSDLDYHLDIESMLMQIPNTKKAA